jgi:hypothetical protein
VTTFFKSILFKVLSVVSILLVALSPLSTYAQYGGGGTGIGGGTGSTSIQVTVSNSESQSAITIVNGKKGDVVNLTIPNSGFGVLTIRFVLGADVSNAIIILKKVSLSEIFPGLERNKKPIVLYTISLSGISYDQILNFSFKFRLAGQRNRRSFEGYSSNSPWISANLNTTTISSDEVEFTANTPIAFKQYTVAAEDSIENTSNGNNGNSSSNTNNDDKKGEVKGASDKKDANSTSSTKKSSDDIELIRTGMSGQSNVFGALIATLSFVLVSFLLYKSNKKA